MKKIKKIAQFLGIIFSQYLIFIFAGLLFAILFVFINNRYGDSFLIQQKWLKFYIQELLCWYTAIIGAAYLAKKITSFKKFIVMECWLSGFTIAVGFFSLLSDKITLVENITSALGILSALFVSYYYTDIENIFKES